jgi:hypothetical protein
VEFKIEISVIEITSLFADDGLGIIGLSYLLN